ncbi:MAG: TRAP transporter large permease subunit, partial [Sciscionella sp.]
MIPAIIFAVLVASLILGVPIAVALGLAGAAGVVVLYGGLSGGAAILSQSIYDTISNFIISAIPLYLLMAYLLLHSGMVGDLFRLGERVLARIPGGLVVASVITSAIFAAASASSSATVATVGGVALPEMLQRGYDRKLSAGALAVSGTLGILIPPSAVLILYGFVTETSVGALFAAGIAPGIMLVVLMSTYVIVKQLHANRAGNAPSAVKASRELVGTAAHQAGSGALAARGGDPGRGSRADPGGGPVPGALGPTMDTDVDHAKAGPKKEWQANLGALGAVLVIPLVLGSIYSGVASPTEAAGIGIVYGLVVSVIRRRLNVRKLWNALGDAAHSAACGSRSRPA